MAEGKVHKACMCMDLAEPSSIGPHPQNYFLALPQYLVSYHQPSLCGKDDPCKGLVNVFHFEGLISLVLSPLPPH